MVSNRPRGFANWRPQTHTAALLDQVQQVLETYRDNLPLTGRQIFYRLVGAAGYDKTEAAYKRLLETLNRARRARLIPMTAIRDDSATVFGANRFDSPEDFLRNCRHWAKTFKLDLQQYQPHHIEGCLQAANSLLTELLNAPTSKSQGTEYSVSTFNQLLQVDH